MTDPRPPPRGRGCTLELPLGRRSPTTTRRVTEVNATLRARAAAVEEETIFEDAEMTVVQDSVDSDEEELEDLTSTSPSILETAAGWLNSSQPPSTTPPPPTFTQLVQTTTLRNQLNEREVTLVEVRSRMEQLEREKMSLAAQLNREIKKNTCTLCLDEESIYAFFSCGHLAVCGSCLPGFVCNAGTCRCDESQNFHVCMQCPVCRAMVSKVKRIFRP